MRSMAPIYARAADDDRMDSGLCDRCDLIKAISSDASRSATSPGIYDFTGT